MLLKVALSSIISHGAMDFYLMKELNVLLLYILNIFVYNYLLIFNKEIFMAVFYLLSCYHFGKDFQIMTQEYDGLVNWSGPYMLAITVDCVDGVKVWHSVLEFIGMDVFSSSALINLVFCIRLISMVGIVFTKNPLIILFCCGATIVNSYLTLYQSVILYMSTIHVPLALCQFYQKFGLAPVRIWFIFTILLSAVKWNVIITENISISIISMTMSHMILISIFQY